MGKPLLIIVLCAGLALQADAAIASFPHHRHAPAALAPAAVRPSPEDVNGYYVPYVTDVAGTRLPILKIPGSVAVVPQQVIQDQQDITVCGALRNVSGVFCR